MALGQGVEGPEAASSLASLKKDWLWTGPDKEDVVR